MRRVVLKSPVLENCTPGSVRGALGNQRPYLAKMGGAEGRRPRKPSRQMSGIASIATERGDFFYRKERKSRKDGRCH